METIRYNDRPPEAMLLGEEDLFDMDRMRDVARRLKGANVTSIRLTKMQHVKPNDRCPCGGRLKFKKCCQPKYEEMQ